jgi:hypothetical protein
MKRLTLLVCLLLPLAAWAQVNTDLFDTGFHSSSAIGQLEEMSGQSISGSSYGSGIYSTSSGNPHYNSGTTGADAVRNAKSKFRKPSARIPKYRPPRPSRAQREYAGKLKKWNSRSRKTREAAENAQRYSRTSNFKLKDVRPLPENPLGAAIPRMVIPRNIPRHITLDYPVHRDTVWTKLPDGTLEGKVQVSKYFAFGAIPDEEGWYNELRFTNPSSKEISVRVEYELKYGKDGAIRKEHKIVHMPPVRINEPSVYNNSLGVYTDQSTRYRILNVTML